MHFERGLSAAAAMLGCLAVAATAFGHANFKPKDVDPMYAGRTYAEGTTAYLSLIAAHGCRDEAGEGHPTRHVYALFPNAEALSGIAYSEGAGERYAGNALMGIRPATSHDFRTVERERGAVPAYYSHGVNESDVRAIHWEGGRVPDDMYAEMQVRATFPKLDGCVERLRVFVPTVQYCDGGLKNAWLREATQAFGEDEISVGYAPYFDVLRDYDANPLPDSCAEGESVEVYPSAEDVDRYLTRPAARGVRRWW